MKTETMTGQRIFGPADDPLLFHLLEKSEEIAIAAVQASGAPEEWTEDEIGIAIRQSTGRWGSDPFKKIPHFMANAVKMGLPKRPVIQGTTSILQYGIGELAVDILIGWSLPRLLLTPNAGTDIGKVTEDPSGYRWAVGNGQTGALALLANIPLVKPDPCPQTLGETLRKLTTFRFLFSELDNIARMPTPGSLYVLCHRDYAKAINGALFGVLIEEDIFTVLHPKPPIFG